MTSTTEMPKDLPAAQGLIVELLTENDSLKQRLSWFERQIFGPKSERVIADNPQQLYLGQRFEAGQKPPAQEATVASHVRRKKQPIDARHFVGETGLRFTAQVPIEEVTLLPLEVKDLLPDQYVVIGEKVTEHLCQKPSCYFIKRYRRPVVKLKDQTDGQKLLTAPTPCSVLEGSYADNSLLAGLLVDKFVYHLPLYRQHQRLDASGIKLDRMTLTHYVHALGDLLAPVYEAQAASVLESRVLAMDETPIKAGTKKDQAGKGSMKQGYFWPVYGNRHEIIFPFSETRAAAVIKKVLGSYGGVLQSDGYAAYDAYIEETKQAQHAYCWAHTRREFHDALAYEPRLAQEAIKRIGLLYDLEESVRELDGKERLLMRSLWIAPIVESFFSWLKEQIKAREFLPSNAFFQAAGYALKREVGLKVYLENPEVAIDTNHLERSIRPIAVGRKNWLFCWTEIGAKYVGVFQSLLSTCRLHGVNPYDYLVDILPRLSTTPLSQVATLTPRIWAKDRQQKPNPS